MRFIKENMLLLTVDMQERLMPVIYEQERVIKRASQLIRGFALLDMPVLATEQYPQGLGPTVPGILSALPADAQRLPKTAFSCYKEKPIAQAIQASGCGTVVLAGAETHVCVLQTALDLVADDYDVILCADAVSSRRKEDKLCAEELMRNQGIAVASMEMILFLLTENSKNPTFKAISAIVKE